MFNTDELAKPNKLAYSIQDTAWVLGDVSQNHVRNLIKNKRLEQIKIGRRVMVTAASIQRLVESGGAKNVSALEEN